nr:MAG TPA: hypothetical protein [Microviridae sp.]
MKGALAPCRAELKRSSANSFLFSAVRVSTVSTFSTGFQHKVAQ